MPIYEYACEKCESEFEIEQRITDAPLKTCPKCRSRRVKRLISQTSFVLKGGGWYADAYASTPKSGSKSEGGDASDAKPDAKTTESKPADSGGESKPKGGGSGKRKAKGAKAAA